jgi:hypothetical protein
VVPLVVAGLIVVGCGSGGGSDSPPPQPQPSAKPADFPRGRGHTIQQLQSMGGRSLVFAPSVQDLKRGMNRYGFALFDSARKQVTGAEVALYTARADGSHVRGPYIARSESLKVSGVFQSRTTASDPNSAKAVYVADVPFRHTGEQVITAIAKLDGRLINTPRADLGPLRGRLLGRRARARDRKGGLTAPPAAGAGAGLAFGRPGR